MKALNRQLQKLDKWRSQFNPLRGLDVQRAVSLLEQGERGAYVDLMWTYRFIEMSYPTLSALIARRTGAMKRLEWHIKQVPEDELPTGCTKADADAQVQTLTTVYDNIDNLRQAIEFLAMAEFRGFAHLEKQFCIDGKDPMSPQTPSQVNRLEPVEQWYWVRDGVNGDWKYNGEAKRGTVQGEDIEPSNFIIREVMRPINRIAIIAFLRIGLVEKDWDAFCELFGLNSSVVIGPPNVPTDKETQYRDAAERVAAGESGYLPNGADVKYPQGARGLQPFDKRKRDQNEDVVLAGTGGLLTMLTESGSGTLAGTAHRETFEKMAEAEAGTISEYFQHELSAPILAEKHPGKPCLAYFELAATDAVDITLVADHADKFTSAGFKLDADQLSEITGYKLTKSQSPQQPGLGVGRVGLGSALQLANRKFWHRAFDAVRVLFNRDAVSQDDQAQQDLIDNALTELARAKIADLAPLTRRLEVISSINNPDEKMAALKRLSTELANYQPKNPAMAPVIQKLLTSSLFNGAIQGAQQRRTK